MSTIDKYLLEIQTIQEINNECERKYKSAKSPKNPYASQFLTINCKLEQIHKISNQVKVLLIYGKTDYNSMYEKALNDCVKNIKSGKTSINKLMFNEKHLKEKVWAKKPEIQKLFTQVKRANEEYVKLKTQYKEYRKKFDSWKNSKENKNG